MHRRGLVGNTSSPHSTAAAAAAAARPPGSQRLRATLRGSHWETGSLHSCSAVGWKSLHLHVIKDNILINLCRCPPQALSLSCYIGMPTGSLADVAPQCGEKKILEFDNLEALITAPPTLLPLFPQPTPPCDNRKQRQFICISNCDCDKSGRPGGCDGDGRRLRLVQRNTRKDLKVFVPPVKSRKRCRKKAGEGRGESSEGRRQFELASETQPLRRHAAVIR